METETAPCSSCGHPTATDRVWKALPKPRKVRRRSGTRCYLCAHGRSAGARTTGSERNPQVKRALVLEDWQWLHETGDLTPDQPLADRIRLAAPRIGMSVQALERALHRAGIRNPVEPVAPAKAPGRFGDCLQCRKAATECTTAGDDVRNVARKLARNPDSPRLQAALEDARRRLAESEAWRDLHLDMDHPEVAA